MKLSNHCRLALVVATAALIASPVSLFVAQSVVVVAVEVVVVVVVGILKGY